YLARMGYRATPSASTSPSPPPVIRGILPPTDALCDSCPKLFAGQCLPQSWQRYFFTSAGKHLVADYPD
ncbi:MAG: hypothetical protein ABI418_06070, partial [Jatrophihabitantaceae bacterium]